MFTATADLILPSTVTGSFPRPRWFDVSMWGRPLDTCMLDVRFREKFQDAISVVISDQERAGLDILTHGDFHHHNILRHGDRFVAIDPKPYLGDREYDLFSYLRNPISSRNADRREMLAFCEVVRDHPGTTLEYITNGCLDSFSPEEIDLIVYA